jgi:hypothetical protein
MNEISFSQKISQYHLDEDSYRQRASLKRPLVENRNHNDNNLGIRILI